MKILPGSRITERIGRAAAPVIAAPIGAALAQPTNTGIDAFHYYTEVERSRSFGYILEEIINLGIFKPMRCRPGFGNGGEHVRNTV